jgi:DNA-binding PadR family transcriptional regulator
MGRDRLAGFAIASRLARAAADQTGASEMGIYPALHRLEAEGRVRAVWAANETGRLRRMYSLERRPWRRWL